MTVLDETFTPTHPAVLDPKVVARILRGIQIKHRIGVLQIPFGGAKGPERVFSDEQIEYLTPHIIHAFSKVTQEEQVIFRVSDHYSFEYGVTEGTMSLHRNHVYVTLAYIPKGASLPRKTNRHNMESFIFVPERAIHPGTEPSWFFDQSLNNRLIIDYTLLANPPLDHTSGSTQLVDQEPHQGLSAKNPIPSLPFPRNPSEPQAQMGTKEPATQVVSEDSKRKETHNLEEMVEQIRLLESELAEKKAEIERLKNKRNDHP
ncbi:MAG: hypothetical protein O6840_07640 [Nitrospirae bacterium]|nr:hypothetical protein [Nitrospirota bacterium]